AGVGRGGAGPVGDQSAHDRPHDADRSPSAVDIETRRPHPDPRSGPMCRGRNARGVVRELSDVPAPVVDAGTRSPERDEPRRPTATRRRRRADSTLSFWARPPCRLSTTHRRPIRTPFTRGCRSAARSARASPLTAFRTVLTISVGRAVESYARCGQHGDSAGGMAIPTRLDDERGRDDASGAMTLLDMIQSSWMSQVVYVAASLGIADVLA